MPLGRPTIYDPELAERICETISKTEKGLHQLHREHKEWFADATTIFRWLERFPDFRPIYARARAMQAEYILFQGLEIVDDSSEDTHYIYTKSGEKIAVEDKEWTLRSKLRWEARKYLASKLNPKVWGDKAGLEDSDGNGKRLEIIIKEEPEDDVGTGHDN